MKSLEESIAGSMDAENPELIEYLPYILQDFWEIGASPEIILDLVKKHFPGREGLKVLDIGSGKGAVSVRLAAELRCRCLGIDGISEFTGYSREKAGEFGVAARCTFKTGDIRECLPSLGLYDVIILGATGPILESYGETLTALSGHMGRDSILVMDDGYIDNAGDFDYPPMVRRGELLEHIRRAGMVLSEEVMADDPGKTRDGYRKELEWIRRRCGELARAHPGKAPLFIGYAERQAEEYDILENRATCTTMVMQVARIP